MAKAQAALQTIVDKDLAKQVFVTGFINPSSK
jgi:hypothetical protein